MLAFEPRQAPGVPLKLLFLGAHADDIEIGCGGTVLQLLAGARPVQVHWVVFSSDEVREREARASAELFLERAASRSQVVVRRFRDGHFPWQGEQLKSCFEELKEGLDPDVIFTHAREDLHQDHRTVAELTWNTWRNHLVLEYEIPKYDGDLGRPNVFSPLTRATCERKAQAIVAAFRSQSAKGWMARETFTALARLRGIECAAAEGYAEAFHCRKSVLAF